MPRRKKVETSDDLLSVIAEVQELDNSVAAEMDRVLEANPHEVSSPSADTSCARDPRGSLSEISTVDVKRNELLKLAEDGELDKSVAYIKKASAKVVEKLYVDYERKRARKANEFLTDMFISKFSDVLGGFDAIESSEVLTKELQRDELLKRDVYSVVEKLTPFLPFIGILSGGAITAKHIYDHRSNSSVSTTPEEIVVERAV